MIADDAIIAAILVHEGSAYTNDPADAGGPTRWGITLADLQARHPKRAITAADVQALTRAEATAIYQTIYLRPFDRLRDPLRLNVIDMGVNAGITGATKLLQKLVGADVDGVLGGQTVARVATFDPAQLNTLYVGARLLFYEDLIQRLPRNTKWRTGWRARALSFLTAIEPPTKGPTT